MLVISNWNTMPMQRELSALKYKTDGAMHHAPKGLKPRPQAHKSNTTTGTMNLSLISLDP